MEGIPVILGTDVIYGAVWSIDSPGQQWTVAR